MLANGADNGGQFGSLSKDLHKPATFRQELLDFIASELPRWRDRPDRPRERAETILTSQLAAHLTGVARHSADWDILQFQVEGADEHRKGRKIDLEPRPSGTCIWIEGREYVISQHSSTGGIQRFKAGDHGAAHAIGAMIGYIQEQTTAFWDARVATWIGDLNGTQDGWSLKDLLQLERQDSTLRLSVFRSTHERKRALADIELRHLWLEMN